MSLENVRESLVKVSGPFDVSRTDPVFVHRDVLVTPGYAKFLEKNDDVSIVQPEFSHAHEREGAGKFAVQAYLNHALFLVESLIKAGVPRKDALRLLPKELHDGL